MKININGHEFEVPVSFANSEVTGEQLKNLAGVPRDHVIYNITSEGYRTIDDNQAVRIREGEQFGTVSRFRAGWIIARKDGVCETSHA